MTGAILALDTLVDDITVEQATARSAGWELQSWDGSGSSLGTADAVVHVMTRIDAEFIRRLERCRVIGRFGTGLDTVDREAAGGAGMTVVGVSGYCIPELTAHTVALALSLLRVKSPARPVGQWVQPGWSEFRRAHPLAGDITAHVVGYGMVGSSVAKAFRCLHMRVLVTSRHNAEAAERDGFEVVGLNQGFSCSDLISFHLDLSGETLSSFSAGSLGVIKAGAVVVNTARLALTEGQALVDGLKSGNLGGVGIDARLPDASPLWQVVGRDDVIVTPHIGWYSERSLHVLRQAAVANTIAAYKSQQVASAARPYKRRYAIEQ